LNFVWLLYCFLYIICQILLLITSDSKYKYFSCIRRVVPHPIFPSSNNITICNMYCEFITSSNVNIVYFAEHGNLFLICIHNGRTRVQIEWCVLITNQNYSVLNFNFLTIHSNMNFNYRAREVARLKQLRWNFIQRLSTSFHLL